MSNNTTQGWRSALPPIPNTGAALRRMEARSDG